MTRSIETARRKIETAPRKGYVGEIWLQVIKNYQQLEGLKPAEIAEMLGLKPTYAIDIRKAMKIAPRLVAAGVKPKKI